MSQRAAKIKLCRKASRSSHVWVRPDAKIGMGVLKGEPWHAQTWEESDTLILAALCNIIMMAAVQGIPFMTL